MHILDWIWRLWIPKKPVITVVTDERVPLQIRKKIHRGQYEQSEKIVDNQYVAFGDRVLESGTALGVMELACAQTSGMQTRQGAND